MASRLVSNPARVFAFVNQYVPLQLVSGMKGVGLERDGELVAGVLYEGFSGRNIWIHLAGAPGRRWLNRELLHYAFRYPFVELGVDRVSGYVDARNADARRLNEHLGFREEARLRGAAPDGGDVLIYAMWREDCRYV